MDSHNHAVNSRIHDSLPGMVIVCVAPCRNLRTGETAVVGEELILPSSALGERFPLTRTSQLPPPWTSGIQQQLAKLKTCQE